MSATEIASETPTLLKTAAIIEAEPGRVGSGSNPTILNEPDQTLYLSDVFLQNLGSFVEAVHLQVLVD